MSFIYSPDFPHRQHKELPWGLIRVSFLLHPAFSPLTPQLPTFVCGLTCKAGAAVDHIFLQIYYLRYRPDAPKSSRP